MKIISSAFANNGMIPEKYSCKGEDINPELVFEDVPVDAKSLALIMYDPDAPRAGGFTHWVIFNIPSDTAGISENSKPPGQEVLNDSGKSNYIGPCPPSGTHRYYFKLCALDEILPAGIIQNKNDLIKAMTGHIIEEAELMGKFSK